MTTCHTIIIEHVTTCHNIEGRIIMPSKTFENLDVEKKQKLINCAIKEFSNNLYPEVSINKIIQQAGIPRGSFYMYFKDKDDLFEYLLRSKGKRLKSIIRETLIANNGDLHDSFVDIYNKTTDKIYQKELMGIFKNIFTYLSLKPRKLPSKSPSFSLFVYVKDIINTKNLKDTNLDFVFDMLLHNLLFSIDELTKNNNPNENKEQFLRRIDIICYGIYKEEK